MKTGRPRGRPRGSFTFYTRQLGDQVCELIAQGNTLTSACRMISETLGRKLRPDAFCVWVQRNPDGLKERYAAARQLLILHWADEIIDISDDTSGDKIVDDNGRVRFDHENINRSRLKVDTRKWLLAHLKPDIYGDHIQPAGDGKPAMLVIGLRTPDRDPMALPEAPPREETVLDTTALVEPDEPPAPAHTNGHAIRPHP